jgi:hypothetical protein
MNIRVYKGFRLYAATISFGFDQWDAFWSIGAMGARRFIRGVQTIVGMVATLIRGAGEFIGSVRGQNSVNRRSHVVFNGPGESFLWRGTATRSPTLLGGTAPTEVAFARVVFGPGFRRANGSNWNWEKASDERNQESPSENPSARPDAL